VGRLATVPSFGLGAGIGRCTAGPKALGGTEAGVALTGQELSKPNHTTNDTQAPDRQSEANYA
jgi:hypothetical protein